jgi:hypothetical protein
MEEHNFQTKFRRMVEEGSLPMIFDCPCGIPKVKVSHNTGCSYLAGGRCDCDPEITMLIVPPWKIRQN